ncbi:hypothetical protein JKP88DRAFT_247713 [Tribonema minus]|uniref:Uncharacterized protein n=1 Tax=Tribonema minus TaxID=303371 RepID=A0A836CBK7_9STRA|nr:hypothetical protein JKP88DRAFT_247713 [Tribonema minus]
MTTVPNPIAACIRIAYVEAGFMAGVAQFFPQWTPATMALLSMCQADDSKWHTVQATSSCPELIRQASSVPRPPSSLPGVDFEVSVSMDFIAAAFRTAEERRHRHIAAVDGGQYCGGYQWVLVIGAYPKTRAHKIVGYTLGVYVAHHVAIEGPAQYRAAPCFSNRSIAITCIAANGRQYVHRTESFFANASTMVGDHDFFKVLVTTWDTSDHMGYKHCLKEAGHMSFQAKARLL